MAADTPGSTGKKAEIYKPRSLADKVPPVGGVSPADAVAKAEAAVAAVAKEFEGMLAQELDEIDALMRDYRSTPSEETLKPLFGRIHNLRGQGTTMGYPLITKIGTSFCRYIIDRDMTRPVNAALIDQHLQALRIVMKARQDGSGDEISIQVADALEGAVAKELP